MTHAERLEEARMGRSPIGYMTLARGLLHTSAAREMPRISDNGHEQAHYVACRLDGVSHTLAEMFALGKPPMSNTDREFLEGQGGCYDQFNGNPVLGDFYGGMAKKAGVDTTGKVYLSGLARYPGDPEAWVAGRGDAQRVCEQRGWSCEGSVKVKGAPVNVQKAQGGLASDIVSRLVQERLDAAPPGEKINRAELREEVVQKHAPSWAKREIPGAA